MWWCTPVVAATWEAEAQGLLKPVSCDIATELQPGLQSETLSETKQTKNPETNLPNVPRVAVLF